MSVPRLIITAAPPQGDATALTLDLAQTNELHNLLYRVWLQRTSAELEALLAATGHATGRVTGADRKCPERTMSPARLPVVEEMRMVPVLLDFDQVGELLGVSCRTVRRLVEDGSLAVVEVLTKRRITAHEVNRYIRDNEGHHAHGD